MNPFWKEASMAEPYYVFEGRNLQYPYTQAEGRGGGEGSEEEEGVGRGGGGVKGWQRGGCWGEGGGW